MLANICTYVFVAAVLEVTWALPQEKTDFVVCLQQRHRPACREHSGRVLDSRPRGSRFEPHLRHCVVSLSKTHLSLLSTGSTQEDPSQHN